MEQYSSNTDVKFGDVNLQHSRVQSGTPGAAGWPTIRYYNKKTGIAGADYKQKLQGAVCDELKVDDNMESYVMEAAGVSQCDVDTKTGCSSKEVEYIAKYSDEKSPADVISQLSRLEGMSGTKLKASGLKWKAQRIAILKKLQRSAGSQDL